jgi:hypothetical protein
MHIRLSACLNWETGGQIMMKFDVGISLHLSLKIGGEKVIGGPWFPGLNVENIMKLGFVLE